MNGLEWKFLAIIFLKNISLSQNYYMFTAENLLLKKAETGKKYISLIIQPPETVAFDTFCIYLSIVFPCICIDWIRLYMALWK